MLDYSKIVGLIMFDKGLECFVNSFVDGGVQLSVVGILGYVRQKKEDIVISFGENRVQIPVEQCTEEDVAEVIGQIFGVKEVEEC